MNTRLFKCKLYQYVNINVKVDSLVSINIWCEFCQWPQIKTFYQAKHEVNKS